MLKFNDKMSNLKDVIIKKISIKLKNLAMSIIVETLVSKTEVQNNAVIEDWHLVENGGLIVICYDKKELKD